MTGGPLASLTVEELLQRLASGEPTPGGGSASALAGALGAALVSMVCNLSVGREKYAVHEAEIQAIRSDATRLLDRLRRGIDEDAAAYDRVMAAYRLPRTTDEEKAARTEAIQRATRDAALIPLALAEASAGVLELAGRALGKTNVSAASDLAVAALLSVAALDGAGANVEINLASLRDEQAKAAILARLHTARAGRGEQAARVVERCRG